MDAVSPAKRQASGEAVVHYKVLYPVGCAEGVALEAHGETEVSPVRSTTAQSHRAKRSGLLF